jgi:DNA-binding transcriptional regulator GbsR (MarR family)
MLTQLEQRRRIVLERVAEMQARFGDAALDL